MPGNVVCENALLTCTMGLAPTPLTVTVNQIKKIMGLKVATIMDFAPMVNVKPFGTCKAIVTPAGPGPCVPAPLGPWKPGAVAEKIMGLPVLNSSCTLQCALGGTIQVTMPMDLLQVNST